MKTLIRKEFTLHSGRKQIRLGRRTLVMGVVNVTPDSFSDGGRRLKPAKAVARGLELLRGGADWIDIGGESTRPGSLPVPVEEELRRVLPVVRGLRKKSRAWISIDTTKAEVAEAALSAGADAINDVSSLRFDRRMALVAAERRCPLILMHMRGVPATMQQVSFASDVWRSVRSGLKRSVQKALQAGVRRNQLIVDPGFGFGYVHHGIEHPQDLIRFLECIPESFCIDTDIRRRSQRCLRSRPESRHWSSQIMGDNVKRVPHTTHELFHSVKHVVE